VTGDQLLMPADARLVSQSAAVSMSFLNCEQNIRYGDTAFIYVSHKSIFPQEIAPGKVFQSKFGALKHDDMIGKLYGSKFQCPKGYVFVLKATPELWTVSLPHRTQIMYFADISLVTASLEIRPGSLVAEAGTGSGSMTHSLARNVHPHGKVFTFDFHQKRVLEAADEFKRHGLDQIVVCACRDVCTDGFPNELTGRLDAIFLDLPHPWSCISFAKKSLRSGGRLCCFSPCIEQVQKTHTSLRENLFLDLTTCECLLRPVDTVKSITLKQLNVGTDVKQELPVPSVTDMDASDDTDEYSSSSSSVKKEISSDYIVSFPNTSAAGHTGFLTFATKA
jgi:tRNA (adenine57-N1/adenine58-N1)-methyltransferase